MNTLEPVSVALKFGFLAVLYLFLLWVARSALRDLRGTRRASRLAATVPRAARERATRPPRMRPACTRPPRSARSDIARRAPRLVVERAPAATIRG